MKTYYFLDPNGQITSEDGKTRYKALNGPKAYEFLKSEVGKNRRVVKISDEDDPDEIFLEVAESLIPFARQGERREQYVDDNKKDAKIIEVSLDAPIGEGDPEDDLTLMDIIPNEDESIEEQCDRSLAVEALRQALAYLEEEEYSLITALFLRKEPLNGAEYAESIGKSQQLISYRKKVTLKKLKKLIK